MKYLNVPDCLSKEHCHDSAMRGMGGSLLCAVHWHRDMSPPVTSDISWWGWRVQQRLATVSTSGDSDCRRSWSCWDTIPLRNNVSSSQRRERSALSEQWGDLIYAGGEHGSGGGQGECWFRNPAPWAEKRGNELGSPSPVIWRPLWRKQCRERKLLMSEHRSSQ